MPGALQQKDLSEKARPTVHGPAGKTGETVDAVREFSRCFPAWDIKDGRKAQSLVSFQRLEQAALPCL